MSTSAPVPPGPGASVNRDEEVQGKGSRTLEPRFRSSTAARLSAQRLLVLGALSVLLLSVVRAVTGAEELTSPGTASAALRLAVPIGLAALGGLLSERAGVVNIALEGMLVLGTWFGAYVGYLHGPWWGVLAGCAGGALGGLLHAIATVVFTVDHIVSGVAINLLVGAGGSGLVRYLSAVTYDGVPGAGPTQSPRVDPISSVSVPVLAGGEVLGWRSPDVLGRVDAWGVPVVSDVAGLLRGVTGDVTLLTLLAVALVPAVWFALWRTAHGLRLRSCGESPVAAESLGVDVYRTKIVAVTLSGAMAGLGGAFLVIGSIYREGQVGGRGFIALAALIFGNWRPGGAAGGSLLFGYANALGLRQPAAVHALLLFLAVVLAVLTVRAVLGRSVTRAVGLVLATAALAAWFALTDVVPTQLASITPYVVTLLVLVVAAQRLRPPAADGQPYRRGQG